jgi:hypothetical protein
MFSCRLGIRLCSLSHGGLIPRGRTAPGPLPGRGNCSERLFYALRRRPEKGCRLPSSILIWLLVLCVLVVGFVGDSFQNLVPLYRISEIRFSARVKGVSISNHPKYVNVQPVLLGGYPVVLHKGPPGNRRLSLRDGVNLVIHVSRLPLPNEWKLRAGIWGKGRYDLWRNFELHPLFINPCWSWACIRDTQFDVGECSLSWSPDRCGDSRAAGRPAAGRCRE